MISIVTFGEGREKNHQKDLKYSRVCALPEKGSKKSSCQSSLFPFIPRRKSEAIFSFCQYQQENKFKFTLFKHAKKRQGIRNFSDNR